MTAQNLGIAEIDSVYPSISTCDRSGAPKIVLSENIHLEFLSPFAGFPNFCAALDLPKEMINM